MKYVCILCICVCERERERKTERRQREGEKKGYRMSSDMMVEFMLGEKENGLNCMGRRQE